MCEIMKTIEFSEEDLKNLGDIGQKLFSDENDPRSLAYNRKIVRPQINWLRIVVCSLVPIVASVVLLKIFMYLKLSVVLSVVLTGLLLLLYMFINLKKIIICVVRIYQRLAPEAIRRKCRFEPSCSQYMILAIEKYGLWKGLSKGINRLKRCNINDGGYDYP